MPVTTYTDGVLRAYEVSSPTTRPVTLSEGEDGLFITQGEYRVGLTKEALEVFAPLIAHYNEWGQLPHQKVKTFEVDDWVTCAGEWDENLRIAKVYHGEVPGTGSAVLATANGDIKGPVDFRRLRHV